MRFSSFLGLAISGLLSHRLSNFSVLGADAYRTVRPITSKNIGRDWRKSGRGNRYLPHQSERQRARYERQIAAGQIRFITHGPKAQPGASS